jgi:hypothetical protein
MGCGLLQYTPMSPERRQAFDKEAEREAKAAEFEAEQRRTAALERRQDLEFRGVAVPHTHSEVLASASFGMDRSDAAERRREREAAELLGKPEPRLNRWEVKANVKAAEAEREVAAATQAELREVQAEVTGLKAAIHGLKHGKRRRRSAEQDYHEPRDYVRNSGQIVRGPY